MIRSSSASGFCGGIIETLMGLGMSIRGISHTVSHSESCLLYVYPTESIGVHFLQIQTHLPSTITRLYLSIEDSEYGEYESSSAVEYPIAIDSLYI